ncbi:MAG: serine hydrolase domain-containing protein [Pseudomonadota bacterium]
MSRVRLADCLGQAAAIVLALGCGLFAAAADCPPLPDAFLAGTDVTPALSGVQVAVLSQGEVVCSYAQGTARFLDGDDAEKLSIHHKMRVASMSKLVVALAVMRLAEDGSVDLDADVSSYLGFTLRNPSYPNAPITLRQLLSHTSSIRDGSRYWLEPGETLQAFFEPGSERFEDGAHFASGEERAPGSYFRYANLNFGIIAGVIEQVTGTRFDRYVKESVLEPLGVATASFNPCDVLASGAPLATLYRKRTGDAPWDPEGPWREQVDGAQVTCAIGLPPRARSELVSPFDPVPDYPMGSNPTYFSPQGGLRASAEDVAVLLAALIPRDNAAVSAATVAAMIAPSWTLNADQSNGMTTEFDDPDGDFSGLMSSYGLSVHIVDLASWGLGPDAPVVVGHLGEAYGLLGLALIDPEMGDGLTFLITGTADDPAASPIGVTPLYRVEEEILRWWVETFMSEARPAPSPR